MNRKIIITILIILLIGVVYRIAITWGGNFIFNMDNARDMVEVREMVVLGKLRMIGPTTAIDGFFYGPAWYYMLSIPFLITGGDPYASIIMEIILWAVGGYFLLKLVYQYYGKLAMGAVACIWLASNFIVLATQYAFNPNPIIFLTPVFIFCLIKFLETKKVFYSLASFFLAGLFLQFEITVGLFMPLIIILAIVLSGNNKLFRKRNFWFGVLAFGITLLPQFLFDLRHQFFLTKSLIEYRSGSHGGVEVTTLKRLQSILRSYYDTILPTFLNNQQFTNLTIGAFVIVFAWLLRKKEILKNKLTLISLLLVFVPLIGLVPAKVDLMRWHLNASLVGVIILVGIVIATIYRWSFWGKVLSLLLLALLLKTTAFTMVDYLKASRIDNGGNSLLKVEARAVDYVYQKADGKNFKVYTYLPSVIDYPYQYLFWRQGLKKYGYLPEDYAYAPNKPEYIKYKNLLDKGTHPQSSDLVFLIKEPDQTGLRHLWENTFTKMPLLSSEKIGSLIIETRQEK